MRPSKARTSSSLVGPGKPYKDRKDQALKLGGPFLFYLIVLGIMFIAFGRDQALTLFGLMIAYVVPPAGKETIIPIGILVLDLDWVLVGLCITLVDVVTALFFVWNFDYAKKIPLLGPWIINFEKENSNVMTEKRWLQGMTYIGLVFFVFVPLQGTEGVGGTILGRILGLRPWTVFSAILVGSLTGSLVTAYIAVQVGTALLDVFNSTQSKVIAGIIALVAFGLISYALWRFKKNKRKGRGKAGRDEEE